MGGVGGVPCLTSILDMILSGETVGTEMGDQNEPHDGHKNENNSLLLVLLVPSPVETINSNNLVVRKCHLVQTSPSTPFLSLDFFVFFGESKAYSISFERKRGNLPVPTLLTHLGLHLNLSISIVRAY